MKKIVLSLAALSAVSFALPAFSSEPVAKAAAGAEAKKAEDCEHCHKNKKECKCDHKAKGDKH